MVSRKAMRHTAAELATCGASLGVLSIVIFPLGFVTSIPAAWLGLRSAEISRQLGDRVALSARLATLLGAGYWLLLVMFVYEVNTSQTFT